MRAVRARRFNGCGNLQLLIFSSQLAKTSDRLVQGPRLADPERKTTWATYGLVLVAEWIGLMKFTGYEANGIQPLVAHSPLMGWMHFLSVRRVLAGLGVVEVVIAILIAFRPWSPKTSTVGSALAVVMF